VFHELREQLLAPALRLLLLDALDRPRAEVGIQTRDQLVNDVRVVG
jgi:hypothetical protein